MKGKENRSQSRETGDQRESGGNEQFGETFPLLCGII